MPASILVSVSSSPKVSRSQPLQRSVARSVLFLAWRQGHIFTMWFRHSPFDLGLIPSSGNAPSVLAKEVKVDFLGGTREAQAYLGHAEPDTGLSRSQSPLGLSTPCSPTGQEQPEGYAEPAAVQGKTRPRPTPQAGGGRASRLRQPFPRMGTLACKGGAL